jgi:hypothetical protein
METERLIDRKALLGRLAEARASSPAAQDLPVAPPLPPDITSDIPPEFARRSGARPALTFDPDALTRALRIAGAALVVASASTFMLQHWQVGNDLTRYAMLVGQSLLLAAAAYFVGLTVREGRSARTFLALVLATIPISFAVLGGLVYSQFHLEPLALLPHYASWIAPSKLSALLAVLGTAAVLVPLAAVSFIALARKEAKGLTLAFVLANLLVIVPVREPIAVSVLAGITLFVLWHFEIARFSKTPRLDNLEGKLARGVLFVPPAIMLGRVVHLYDAQPTFVGSLLLIGTALLWLQLGRTKLAFHRDLGAWAAAFLALTGWGMVWFGVVAGVGSTAVSVLSLGLPVAAALVVVALRAANGRDALSACGIVLGLMTAVVASLADLDSMAAFSCVVLGIVVAVWGAALRHRVPLVGGALVALFGLVTQVWLAVHADNLLRWASLSVAGILLIVGSAYLERNRTRLAQAWARLSTRPLQTFEP